MSQKKESSAAGKGARRATVAAADNNFGGRGRFSAQRKMQAVLRLLRGEDLEAVSRELKVTAATLSQWREAFLVGGQTLLKTRSSDERDDEIQRLKAKVGELTMANELLDQKIERLETNVPLGVRRSKR